VIGARLHQWRADLLASFWLRPACMVVAAIIMSETLVRLEGAFNLPDYLDHFIYAGGVAGARDVLSAIAGAMIGVAGTTFSITVAALTLASNQMGPRLLRNFTRDPGNQYALGALVATFAYALVALRSVHEESNTPFVPQLAVSGALLLAFICVGVLIWFLHHVATSISIDHVVALVSDDLTGVLSSLPRAQSFTEGARAGQHQRDADGPPGSPAVLLAHRSGYLRVLDDDALADWAQQQQAFLRLRVRPGHFIFPGSEIGVVWPAAARHAAQQTLESAMSLGATRDVDQDIEFAVRQLVEVGLRALSSGINDAFTAVAVLDRLGAALCELVGRTLLSGETLRNGVPRVQRPSTDYTGLLDAMFHMLRQSGASIPPVMIRLLEVITEVGCLERDPERRVQLRRHADLARRAATADTRDSAALSSIEVRYAEAVAVLSAGEPGTAACHTVPAA